MTAKAAGLAKARTPKAERGGRALKTRKLATQDEFLRILYYGDGGTGKTTDLAAMANLGRVMILDVDPGIKRKPLRNRGINVDNIELADWRDYNPEGRVTFEAMEEISWQLRRELDDDPGSWAGVVWDSGSELYRALLEPLVEHRVDRAERAERGGKSVSELLLNRFFTERDDYGIMSEQMRLLYRRYRDLPCHFGTSWLLRRDVDQNTGRVSYGPAVTPALQVDLAGWPDIICHTYVERGPRRLGGKEVYQGDFRPVVRHKGKDRFDSLPGTLVDPLFDRVRAYVTDELTEADDEQQRRLLREVDPVHGEEEPDDENGDEADEREEVEPKAESDGQGTARPGVTRRKVKRAKTTARR